jgi:AAA+ superfamily predicted ATPase
VTVAARAEHPSIGGTRAVAISGCGDFIAVQQRNGLRILEAAGASAPVDVATDAIDYLWVGGRLWIASVRQLRVLDPRGTELASLEIETDSLLPARAVGGVIADNRLVQLDGDRLSAQPLGAAQNESIIAFLGGLRTLRARETNLRITDPDTEIACFRLLEDGQILAASPILDGAAVAVVSRVGDDLLVDVLKLAGSRINQIELPRACSVVFAPERGIALATVANQHVIAIDLRYGRVVARGPLPLATCSLDIDEEARHVAIVGDPQESPTPVFRVAFAELFAGPELETTTESGESEPQLVPICTTPGEEAEPAAEQPIPAGLVALSPRRPGGPLSSVPDAEPYRDPLDHLDDLTELAIARVALALQDDSGAYDPDELAAAIEDRVAATLAVGRQLPLVEIAEQFELDAAQLEILAVVAAPAVSARAARLYAALANDADRSVCDRAMIIEILGKRVRRALRRGGVLFRCGLLEEARMSSELFAHVFVSEPLLDRLRGEIESRPGETTTLAVAGQPLEALQLPRAQVVALVEHLQLASAEPARVVIRGRTGLGGTELLAALARRAHRPLAVIDAERLPDGEAFVSALRRELVRARLWGALPCVANLDARKRESDERSRPHLREVFRTFDGPLFFRAGADLELPLDPGYFELGLPDLSESARLACWKRALERHDLDPASAAELARQTRLGPSAIDSVVARASSRETNIADIARQHIASRLGKIATRIDRLGRWDQLALDSDTLSAVRELIARSRHRRTVFDHWGFDRRVTTSRGLTALFSGPPGTGKTLVAGVIARELGLDLYRVDLASLVSKWIGETEKNLARLFDAADDAQAVLLFDEADALFARRTDVKSSNDRHANMETGYLLQRLDSFEGIAILTTNLTKSIDKAVSRRLSMKIEFPFPDDETRVALWRAHLPAELPTSGDLELERIAREYPMTGGFVRNCAVRAAFLAAAGCVALTRDHIERAIHLEYTQAGRISPSGRLE